ncbi:MAG: sialate O-acetylesterase [Armatimonadia bacterium]
MTRLWPSLLLVLVLVTAAHADVKLPALVGDNMVLQQQKALKIWGTADPAEKVTVAFNGQTVEATADAQGAWLATLKPIAAGGPFEMTITGKNTITLKNILIGEVWVCSGQSNMQMTVQSSARAPEEIAAANYPQIRLFRVPNKTAVEPQTDVVSQWQECSPATVPSFSAAGYFFGRDLHQALKVPVGLINSSWGGTAAEAWTTVPSLKADPEYQTMFERWDKMIADYPANMEKWKAAVEKWKADVEAWNAACEKAKAENQPLPPKPVQPRGPNGPESPNRPGNLYNGMINPLINFAIRGAIWYQGEANAGRAYQYRKLMPLMITDWRTKWGYDFPFYQVNLANYMARKDQPGDSAWAELREAQTMTAALPNNGQAVIIDVGLADNIHPTDKQTVGNRLAVLALAKTYGKGNEWSGPMYDKMAVENGKIRLTFTHADGMATKDGGPVKGFAIAGEDKKFVWAEAKIDGKSIVVSSPEVAAPVAVRYAWADNPDTNLYNAAGLPAVPFRTDDWPGCTATAH